MDEFSFTGAPNPYMLRPSFHKSCINCALEACLLNAPVLHEIIERIQRPNNHDMLPPDILFSPVRRSMLDVCDLSSHYRQIESVLHFSSGAFSHDPCLNVIALVAGPYIKWPSDNPCTCPFPLAPLHRLIFPCAAP